MDCDREPEDNLEDEDDGADDNAYAVEMSGISKEMPLWLKKVNSFICPQKYKEPMIFERGGGDSKTFDPNDWTLKEIKAILLRCTALLVRYQCPHCEDSFGSEQAKSLHIRASHQDIKYNITCPDCLKVYEYNSNYIAHKKHDRCYEKPTIFECKLIINGVKCGHEFASKLQLNNHFQIHRNDKEIRPTIPLPIRYKRYYCYRCDSECADTSGNCNKHNCPCYEKKKRNGLQVPIMVKLPDGQLQSRAERPLVKVDIHKLRLMDSVSTVDTSAFVGEEAFVRNLINGKDFATVECCEAADYFNPRRTFPNQVPAAAVAKPRNKVYANINRNDLHILDISGIVPSADKPGPSGVQPPGFRRLSNDKSSDEDMEGWERNATATSYLERMTGDGEFIPRTSNNQSSLMSTISTMSTMSSTSLKTRRDRDLTYVPSEESDDSDDDYQSRPIKLIKPKPLKGIAHKRAFNILLNLHHETIANSNFEKYVKTEELNPTNPVRSIIAKCFPQTLDNLCPFCLDQTFETKELRDYHLDLESRQYCLIKNHLSNESKKEDFTKKYDPKQIFEDFTIEMYQRCLLELKYL